MQAWQSKFCDTQEEDHMVDCQHLPNTDDMTVIHGFDVVLFGFLTRSTFTGGRRIGLLGIVGGFAFEVARRGPQLSLRMLLELNCSSLGST